MTATMRRRGEYTIFQTVHGNRMITLDNELWFAWVVGERGELLVRSDANHERERTVRQGEYYLVEFRADASFTDLPHLFLQRDDQFQEIILPNGLPTDDDPQKRVVETANTIPRGDLERHLATGAPEATGAPTSPAGDRELPIPDYDELSVRGAKPRLDALNADELRRLRAYEAENKKRKTLIHEIDRRLR